MMLDRRFPNLRLATRLSCILYLYVYAKDPRTHDDEGIQRKTARISNRYNQVHTCPDISNGKVTKSQ